MCYLLLISSATELWCIKPADRCRSRLDQLGKGLSPQGPCGAINLIQFNLLVDGVCVGPCSMEGYLFSSQCLCETILMTLYLMVWDWQVLRAEPIVFIVVHGRSLPFCQIICYFFLSMAWYYEAGVFGVIRFKSFSRSTALPIIFTNNDDDNNNNYCYINNNNLTNSKKKINYSN